VEAAAQPPFPTNCTAISGNRCTVTTDHVVQIDPKKLKGVKIGYDLTWEADAGATANANGGSSADQGHAYYKLRQVGDLSKPNWPKLHILLP
jgi:hypothetical protein